MTTEVKLLVPDSIIETMKELSGQDDLVEIVRRAMAVYKHLWEHKKAGCELIIRDGDNEKQLVLI